MGSTIWKGQLAFGLVSFPVRLQKAARRERLALKYVTETHAGAGAESDPSETVQQHEEQGQSARGGTPRHLAPYEPQAEILPARQGYFSEGQREPLASVDLQRGYQVSPDKFVVVGSEELKKLRKETSTDMQILRS